jgi:hypothetical protein
LRPLLPILHLAAGHHGGQAAVLKLAANGHAQADMSRVSADRLLSVMTRCVFNAATSKRDLARVQDAFNTWHGESGLPRAAISRILALSVG